MNNIVIEKSNNDNFITFVKIALKNKLYVEGFSLKSLLKNLTMSKLRRTEEDFICLLKYNGKYVGFCGFFLKERATIQTYVVPEFRRNGFSLKMIEFVLSNISFEFKNKISFYMGEFQSLILFRKLIKLGLINYENLEEFIKERIQVIDLIMYASENNIKPTINDKYIVLEEFYRRSEKKLLLNIIKNKEWIDLINNCD